MREVKSVLIVDDILGVREELARQFEGRSKNPECPYQFHVELASTLEECRSKVNQSLSLGQPYDVAVLDLRLELGSTYSHGVEIAAALSEKVAKSVQVEIIFTAYASIETCVQVMRSGAWDYIDKVESEEALETGRVDSAMGRVVASAESRLRELDLERELRRRISEEWLPQNLWSLEKDFAGQLVAIWHEPEMRVVASAADGFELNEALARWQKDGGYLSWQRPFIVKIPERPGE
jgi:ActR/RegA family two-component response regulator